MRFTGKLTTWHEDRGFGFITPDGGGQEIFVHVSELPHGRAPAIGQVYGFEVALNPQGKKKAVGVYVHNEQLVRGPQRKRHRVDSSDESFGFFSTAILFLVLCGIVYGVYRHQSAGFVAKPHASTPYKCDGRQHCSQMSSCKEAKYFLNNCPGTLMDGDNDGIPCEQDLCTGFLGGLLR